MQLEALEPIVELGLTSDPRLRWPHAAEMEAALAQAVTPARPNDVAAWLGEVGREFIARRERAIAEDEVSYRRGSAEMPRLGSANDAAPVPAVAPEPPDAAPHPRVTRQVSLIAGAAVIVFAIAFGAALAMHGDADPPPPVADVPAAAAAAPALPAPPAPAARPVPMLTPPDAPQSCPPPVEPPPPSPAAHKRIVTRKPPPKPSCATPYYYRGQKKIFKPQCL